MIASKLPRPAIHFAAQEIASRLLQDIEARNSVEAARGQLQEKPSLVWLAGNMISWFSRSITVGDSEWVRAFERTKIDGVWAYKPVTAASQCAAEPGAAPDSRRKAGGGSSARSGG